MANEHIALDIGHGTDTWEKGGGKGVRKNGIVYEEHTANSDTAERVRKILEAHGLKVWMPQKPMSPDRSLASRTAEANRRGVKLYWSIHYDAGAPSARGAWAFYWNTSAKMKKIAEQYAANAKAAGLAVHGTGAHPSRIGDWTNFHVLRETKMPAILTENGFMTNAQDFEGIFGKNKAAYRQKVAEVNAQTILGYFGIKYDPKKSGGIIVQASKKPVKINPKYTHDPQDRKGEVVLKMEMNYRTEPSLSAPVIRVLPKGHGSNPKKPVHYYEIKGDWIRLGIGWVSNKDGKYVEIKKRYVKPPQPAEPKKTIYRVIVDGVQVGAYSQDDNALKQAELSIAKGAKNIEIQKI